MPCIVASISLRRSHSFGLNLASLHARSISVFPPPHSRTRSPCDNRTLFPSCQTPTQSFALFQLSKISASSVTVRAASIITIPGKDLSLPQAEPPPNSVNTPKAKGTTKSVRSPSRKSAIPQVGASSPSSTDHVDFKTGNARDDNGDIAYSDFTKRDGNGDSPVVPNHADRLVDRGSFPARRTEISHRKHSRDSLTADDKSVGALDDVNPGKDSTRSAKVIASSKEGTPKRKARSYESLLDASVPTSESGGSSGDQVSTGKETFGLSSKIHNVRSHNAHSKARGRPVDSRYLPEQVPAGEGSAKVRAGKVTSPGLTEMPVLSELSEAEIAPEGMDRGSQNVGDKHKKPFLQIAFPVTVFAELWFNGFLSGTGAFKTAISKLYVWLGAYQRAHLDATGYYADVLSAANVSSKLEDLKTAVTNNVFSWGDTNNIYLPSPSESTRKHPSLLSDVDTNFSFQDRVVQELLYLIMEPIFEAQFSTRSHASRPGRDAHTALRAAQRSFLGCRWFINGDLSTLEEDDYAFQLVESVIRVVGDPRIIFLLKSGFLGFPVRRQQPIGKHPLFTCATQGSCGRLKHLMYNVVLDPLDWWMDKKISDLTKQNQPLDEGAMEVVSMPARTTVKRTHKLEYVRYGTKFWVGYNGTKEEIGLIQQDIISFLQQKFGKSFQSKLWVSHISDGVKILDHVISEKVERPIFKRRTASCGRVVEKRALRIKLCINACIDRCLKYLKQVAVPASVQHINEVLLVLDYWYSYAENKERVMDYCKLALCYKYAKGAEKFEEESMKTDFVKKALQGVVGRKQEDSHQASSQVFIRIPEHEMVFRDHAWLQSKASTTKIKDRFKKMRIASPQKSMSQVLWQYCRPRRGKSGWDLEHQMQTSSLGQGPMVNLEFEEHAESVVGGLVDSADLHGNQLYSRIGSVAA